MELCNTDSLVVRKKRKRKQKSTQKHLHNNDNAFHGRKGSPSFEDNNLERLSCSNTHACPEDAHIVNNISLKSDFGVVSPSDTSAKMDLERAQTNVDPSCSRKGGKKRTRKRKNTIINDEHPRVESDMPKKVIKAYARSNGRKRRKSAKSVTSQQFIEENEGRGMSCNTSNELHLSKNNLETPPNETHAISLQVVEDILVEEAPFNCSDAKPASHELMKQNKTKNLINSLPEGSFALDVPLVNVRGHTKKKSEGEVSVLDVFHGNAIKSQTKKVISSSSQLDVIHVDVAHDCMNTVDYPPLSSPQRAIIDHSKKKLLILDVNGLLADIVPFVPDGCKPDITISMKSVFKRPFCDDFLRFCFASFNVGIWSSRTKRNVNMVVDFLMGNSRHELLFCWDQSHCTDTGYTTVENRKKPLVLKELKKIWEKGEYNESNTLLLDDSPYKALRNPAHTAIFPPTYDYRDAKDNSLGPGGDLRMYLEGLALAENVQKYVEQNPFGQGAITESNPSWGFYRKILDPDFKKPQDVRICFTRQ